MRISEAEAAVMEVLWRQAQPQTAEDVVQALAPAQDWQPATVKTLLNRLLNKGAIGAEREGRRYHYAPLLTREQWLDQESQGFVQRLFGGRVAPLVAHFSERQGLSRRDIDDLKRLIEELDDDR